MISQAEVIQREYLAIYIYIFSRFTVVYTNQQLILGKSDSGVKSAKSNPSAAEADIIRLKLIFLFKNPSNSSSLRLSETRWGSLYMFGQMAVLHPETLRPSTFLQLTIISPKNRVKIIRFLLKDILVETAALR